MDKDQRVRELEKRVAELEQLWEEHIRICPLCREKELPPFVKPNNNHQHKKNEQKNGHKGYSRHIPKRIDVAKEHKFGRKFRIAGVGIS